MQLHRGRRVSLRGDALSGDRDISRLHLQFRGSSSSPVIYHRSHNANNELPLIVNESMCKRRCFALTGNADSAYRFGRIGSRLPQFLDKCSKDVTSTLLHIVSIKASAPICIATPFNFLQILGHFLLNRGFCRTGTR